MKVTTATKKLEKAGFEITSNLGTFIAAKDNAIIRFFENGAGSGRCSKFTYDSATACAPTYGMSLRQAMAIA